MILVVAEKPSVAKTIASVLGANSRDDGYISNDKYIVSWCLGHLVALAPPDVYDEKFAVKPWKMENLPIIPDKWIYQVNKSTEKQFSVLKKLMLRSDVSEIVCATDAGREGEGIFRYVYDKIGCTKPVKRLWTSSLEESAIRKGFDELKSDSEYDNLYKACCARNEADWLVGMNATRLFSAKYAVFLSVGRVQTPTLAMIVSRDEKIKNFVKEQYYTVDIDCGGFTAVSQRIDNANEAADLKSKTDGASVKVVSAEKTTKKINPPKLYDLTTLQREANRIYGYTAQQTLDCVQSLYEQKLCTYPRTDSQYITDDMENTAASLVDTVTDVFNLSVNMPSPDIKRVINNKKVSDHHALLPTAEISEADIGDLPDTEKNILRLISIRLLCAVHKPHIYEATTVELVSHGDADKHIFKATGKTVVDNGFKELIGKENDSEGGQALPDLTENQEIDYVTSAVSSHFTSPPKQFTEDTLLSAMETAGNSDYDENSDIEKKGLGTPATRASIIETLVKREYIKREKKSLVPTDTGKKLIECIPDEVKSPKMTADWETMLQNIEKGKTSDIEFLTEIESFVRSLVKKYSSSDEKYTFRTRKSIGICPACGGNVLETPKAYSCENSGKNGSCPLVIWKTVAGKGISEAQAKKLLESGKTDLIKGFKSKAGKSFDAYLTLGNAYNTEFEFPKKPGNCKYKNNGRYYKR